VVVAGHHDGDVDGSWIAHGEHHDGTRTGLMPRTAPAR
jgi:hypothetical protein